MTASLNVATNARAPEENQFANQSERRQLAILNRDLIRSFQQVLRQKSRKN